MNKNRTVLAQMQQLFSRYHFEKLVNEHKSDKNVRTFSSWNLLHVMLYVQIVQKKSLRDICMSLQSKTSNWYHLGLQSLSRNNLSNSLMKRPAIVFKKTFHMMLAQLQKTKNQATDKAIMYLLTEYLRFISKTAFSRMEIFRIINVNIFASRNLMELLNTKFQCIKKKFTRLDVQLVLGF